MYKKYITRKGKKTGPYYYESFRLKNGKIKTIYLGKTPDKEKLANAVRKLKVDIDDVVVKGKSTIIPISAEGKVVRDALALSEIFKDTVSNIEKKIIIPRFRLPKIEFKEIDLFKLFRKDKVNREQKKLHEFNEQTALKDFIPMPGKLDFNFEVLLFVLISIAYVFGFFYLDGAISGYSVLSLEGIGVNFFPVLMAIVNLVLIILIYFDLKGSNKNSIKRL